MEKLETLRKVVEVPDTTFYGAYDYDGKENLLDTLIEAIFYYVGGFLISVKGTTQNEILILK